MLNKYFLFCISFLFAVYANAQWQQLNDIPFETNHSNGFGANGKGYIIKGTPDNNGGQFQNELWEYDPQSDSWENMGFASGPSRELAIGDDMDGKYYFGFGVGRSDLWVFDPSDSSFTELPSCPCEPRGHPAFVAHLGKVYVGAGSGNSSDLKDWWVYDLESQSWSEKSEITGANRHHPYQFGIGGGIYVGGGHIGNWLRFDIDTETWSEINSFPEGRVAGTQFSHEGNGFVLSGDAANHDILADKQFLVYFADLDEWFELPFESEMHRWAPSSFIIENEIFYFGGVTYVGDDDSDMWKFDLNSVECLASTSHTAVNITENSVGLFFTSSPTGPTDTLQWRVVGSPEWNSVLNPVALYQLNDLIPCTDYEFRLNYGCPSNNSAYTDIKYFTTKGCGACIDLTYCQIQDEFLALNCYVNRVKINEYENVSGDNEGFQEFTSSSEAVVLQGELLNLEVEPGYTGSTQDGAVKVWLDLNSDGDYTSDELILEDSSVSNLYSGSFEIPLTAVAGITRMRIIFDINSIDGPCAGTVFSDGEVEDYCVTIGNGLTDLNFIEDKSSMKAHPNPANQLLHLDLNLREVEFISIFDIDGNRMKEVYTDFENIDVGDLGNGVYILKIVQSEVVSYINIIKQN